VQVKGGQLKVTGEHLMISYYTNDEMKMTGWIRNIEYHCSE
jgi:hypothetical protein